MGTFWLIALVGVPSGYRTERWWQTGKTREQTGPVACNLDRGRSLGQEPVNCPAHPPFRHT